jgi:putative ABC transport system permease protein
MKAAKYKRIEFADLEAVEQRCANCGQVGGSVTSTTRVRYGDLELSDISLIGHTPLMARIDSRTVELGRYFTANEESRALQVCLIGDTLRAQFFPGTNPLGRVIRLGNQEFTVIGAFEKIGAVLGQDSDSFVIIPMQAFLRVRGQRNTVTMNIRVPGGKQELEAAMDEVRQILRARRHVAPAAEDDFFLGTRDSYIALWNSISGAFFAVFILVSGISAFVGGIVIMNVMLVSVTERTKEIGVRRAMGATQNDIRKQFLTESVMQCVLGGFVGIAAGFFAAYLVRAVTSFPVDVKLWVALFGIGMSTTIGLFFGIYPAVRASKLDPVNALRSE